MGRMVPAAGLLAAGLLLAGCGDALETKAESERLNAQAQRDEAQARLISAQAISATLAVQAAQTERLAGAVIESAQAWRVLAIMLAGVLGIVAPLRDLPYLTVVKAIMLAGVLGIVAIVGLAGAVMVLQRPHTTVYLPGPDTAPQLPSPHELPEVRAMRRALIASQREARR